jgi:hypothetical protein
MAIEDLREIGNVLYERRSDGMLYPVRRVSPDTEARGVPAQDPSLLNVGGIGQRLGLLNQFFNPVEAIGQSMQAGERMMSPNMGVMDRVAALGDMLSGVAGVTGPAVVAGRAGVPAAAAVMEGLLGGSPTTQAAGDTMRAVGRDVVERLNQPGQMPTTYANPIPGLRLFHGSPHDFDRFSMSKIGTGEGAQAYGHGLYFAENEGIARGYRDALTDPDAVPLQFDGRPVNTPWNEEIRERWPEYFSGLSESDADAMEELLGNLSQVNNMADIPNVLGGVSSRAKVLYSRIVKPKLTKPDVGAGRMYEVEINANPEDFLDWDKPLSEQPQRVRDALGRIGITSADTGNEAYMRSSLQRFAIMKPDGTFGPGPDTYDEALALVGGDPSKVRRISEGSAPMRSEALRREGIPGIRYLDAGSRSAGDGSRNYVVFDENLIEIVRKYGIAGAAAMLGMSQADLAQAMQQQQQQQPQGLLSGAQ